MTMLCLSCGHCCRALSPFTDSESEPCPYLEMAGTVSSCSIYHKRPEQCANHDFPSWVCPIGASMLDIDSSDEEAVKERGRAIAEVRYPNPFKVLRKEQ